MKQQRINSFLLKKIEMNLTIYIIYLSDKFEFTEIRHDTE